MLKISKLQFKFDMEGSEADCQPSPETSQLATSTVNYGPISGDQTLSSAAAGIIMRLERGVISAVGGAVNKLTG